MSEQGEGITSENTTDSEITQPIIWEDLTEQDGFTTEQIAVLKRVDTQKCLKLRNRYIPEIPQDYSEFIKTFKLDALGVSQSDIESMKRARLHIGNLVKFAHEYVLRDNFKTHEERIPWVEGLSPVERTHYEASPNQSRNGRLIRVHSAFQWMVQRSRRVDPEFLAFITPQYDFMAGVAVGVESHGVKYQDITDANQMVPIVRNVLDRVENVFGRLTGVNVKDPAVPKIKVT